MRVLLAILMAFAGVMPGAKARAVERPDDILSAYQEQIGYQQRVIMEERKALKKAYDTRDNSVHLTRDFVHLLGEGLGAGYLSYRFLNKTDNMAGLRNWLAGKRMPKELVPTGQVTPKPAAAVRAEERANAVEQEAGKAAEVSAGAARTEVTAEAAAAEAAKIASAARRASTLRAIGSGIMRTSEILGAGLLTVFFVTEFVETVDDIKIRVKDTDEIRSHLTRLDEAQTSLDIANQNLQRAILAQGS